MFEDELNVMPPGIKDDCMTLVDLEDDLILCFPQPASSKEDGPGDKVKSGFRRDNGETMTTSIAVRLTKIKRYVKAEGARSSKMVYDNN